MGLQDKVQDLVIQAGSGTLSPPSVQLLASCRQRRLRLLLRERDGATRRIQALPLDEAVLAAEFPVWVAARD